GGTNLDEITNITADAYGNCYVTGFFMSDSLHIGNHTLVNTVFTGYMDTFIAKYDSSGNCIWATSFGGDDDEFGGGIVTDADNNLFLTGGSWSYQVHFGSYTFNNSGPPRMYIIKYDTAGTFHWVSSYSDGGNSGGANIHRDLNDNLYVTGSFHGQYIIFGNDTLNNPGWNQEIFILKCDTAGNIKWAKSAHGNGQDDIGATLLDANSNLVVSGVFYSDSIIFENTVLINSDTINNLGDIFLAKYDTSGNVLWAKKAGGISWDTNGGVTCDAGGNIYMSGSFRYPSIDIDTITLINADTLNDTDDIFVAKFDSAGNIQWAIRAGSENTDYGTNLSADASGNIYVTGFFESDSIVLGNTVLANSGYRDFYLAKLGDITGINKNVPLANSNAVAFPNPFSDITTIEFSSSENFTGVTLNLYDVWGREILSKIFSGTKISLNRRGISSGVYCYKISNGQKNSWTGKIVIQ
ncbi:MAG: T9SS type A sorting domain-containing protein, partial [Bacteroidota bacterium]